MRLRCACSEGEDAGGEIKHTERREVSGDGELPGAAGFKGIEEDGAGALDSGRDGFSSGERAHVVVWMRVSQG